jgi:transposase
MATSRAEQWRIRVRSWKRSGLTARQFAEIEGLSAGTLRWWSSRLRSKGAASSRARTTTQVAPATMPRPTEVALVQVVPTPAQRVADSGASDTPIEVVLGDVVVRVRRGFDPATLGRVLDVLEGEESTTC